jgi:hypothetical protein
MSQLASCNNASSQRAQAVEVYSKMYVCDGLYPKGTRSTDLRTTRDCVAQARSLRVPL